MPPLRGVYWRAVVCIPVGFAAHAEYGAVEAHRVDDTVALVQRRLAKESRESPTFYQVDRTGSSSCINGPYYSVKHVEDWWGSLGVEEEHKGDFKSKGHWSGIYNHDLVPMREGFCTEHGFSYGCWPLGDFGGPEDQTQCFKDRKEKAKFIGMSLEYDEKLYAHPLFRIWWYDANKEYDFETAHGVGSFENMRKHEEADQMMAGSKISTKPWQVGTDVKQAAHKYVHLKQTEGGPSCIYGEGEIVQSGQPWWASTKGVERDYDFNGPGTGANVNATGSPSAESGSCPENGFTFGCWDVDAMFRGPKVTQCFKSWTAKEAYLNAHIKDVIGLGLHPAVRSFMEWATHQRKFEAASDSPAVAEGGPPPPLAAPTAPPNGAELARNRS